MKCKSGQHAWVSPVNAARCCDPRWKRVSVPENEAKTLDINGRIYEEDSCTVSGWIEQLNNMELNDATVKTQYIGDSVYVSEIFHDPTTISLFLNNGEQQTPNFILRKSEIVLEKNVAIALVRYIQERIEV